MQSESVVSNFKQGDRGRVKPAAIPTTVQKQTGEKEANYKAGSLSKLDKDHVIKDIQFSSPIC